MPVKMVASRRYYHRAESREYEPGEVFEVEDEQAADRLEKMYKATRHVAPQRKPKKEAEEPQEQQTVKITVDPDEMAKKNRIDPPTYRRRDLRSEG